MKQTDFYERAMGLISCVTRPLLSSFILIDDLIQEEDNDLGTQGELINLSQQIQSSIEYLLELRALTMAILEMEVTKLDKPNDKVSKGKCNKIICGILSLIPLELSINMYHFCQNNVL